MNQEKSLLEIMIENGWAILIIIVLVAVLTYFTNNNPEIKYSQAMEKYADRFCTENGYQQGDYWGGKVNNGITISEYITCTKPSEQCTPDGQCFPTIQETIFSKGVDW